MGKKQLFSLLGFIMLLLVSCGESPQPEKEEIKKTEPKASILTAECQLNLGWDPWAPYQYLTPEDEVKGLEIDLISAMAKGAGCSIKFVQNDWMKLLNGIRSGQVDMLGGASQTKIREKFALFSNIYRRESFVLYVRDGDSEKFLGKSLKELLDGDFKLGITQDYIYGDKVTELQDDEAYSTKFVSVPISEVNFYNLLQNHIDGFLEDPFVAAYTIKRKGLQGQIEAHAIEIHSGEVAIMFSKRSVKPETVAAFNKALAKLKETGEYQKILAKYSH